MKTISVNAAGLSLLTSFALRYCYNLKTAAAHAAIAQQHNWPTEAMSND